MAILAGRESELTILLLEDADDLRELITLMLAAPGRRILVAATQVEALEHARSTAIDLLITDVALPGLDGLEIAKQLRSRQPGLRVLYISGWFDHPKFPELESENVLRKPFSRDNLSQAIRQALGRPPTGPA